MQRQSLLPNIVSLVLKDAWMPKTSSDDAFLRGRTALITGGLSGVGFAIAKKLAAHGANVAIGSRRVETGEVSSIVSQLSSFGTRVHAAPLDVRDGASVEAFMRAVEAAISPIDILVNAAGITAEQGVDGHSDALWDHILDTNLNGAFRMTRACLPGMIQRGWGRIINIGSTAATVGWKDNPAYCASKAGLLGLTRCVALEGAPHGVSCTMISPTWVETELMHTNTAELAEREGRGRTSADIMADIKAQNPQKRIIQPEEVAATAGFLCRDEAMGLSMDNIQITGGALW